MELHPVVLAKLNALINQENFRYIKNITINKVNKEDFDCSIEVHFDSSKNKGQKLCTINSKGNVYWKDKE